MNLNEKSKTILFGALDWGLGHATRSMPLIDSLLEQGHRVILASSGDAADLWRLHYPYLELLALSENKVIYGQNASWSALGQSGRFLKNILLENRLVAQFVEKNKIDLIVSDNRYGLYHTHIPSILLTHQLQLLPPKSNWFVQQLWTKSWLNARKRLFSPFREIWVPDFADEMDNLSGDLSHNKFALPIRYIGPLSRLIPVAEIKKKIGLLLLLSGPEPQRSYLEAKLLEQLSDIATPITLVRGLPSRSIPLPKSSTQLYNFRCFDYLDAEALSREIAAHETVIARSGYSTLMDLQQLGAKAVFIPTPGQAEQEYLAQRLENKRIAAFHEQKNINLALLLQQNETYRGFVPREKLDHIQLWGETLSSLSA